LQLFVFLLIVSFVAPYFGLSSTSSELSSHEIIEVIILEPGVGTFSGTLKPGGSVMLVVPLWEIEEPVRNDEGLGPGKSDYYPWHWIQGPCVTGFWVDYSPMSVMMQGKIESQNTNFWYSEVSVNSPLRGSKLVTSCYTPDYFRFCIRNLDAERTVCYAGSYWFRQ